MATSAPSIPLSTGPIRGASSPGQDRDPIAIFASEVEKKRAVGSDAFTVIGWSLFLWVTIDAVLNARGNGALSMLLSRMFIDEPDAPRAQAVDFALKFAIPQIVLLGIAIFCLSLSPWRRWLRVALTDARPGRWIFATGETEPRPGLQPIGITHHPRRNVFELLLFSGSLAVMAPSVAIFWAITHFSAALASILIVLLAYGVTWVVMAIGPNARLDRSTTAGVLIGCFVPLAAAFYADLAAAEFQGTAAAHAEFCGVQLIICAIAIGSLWLGQLGSIQDNDLLVLDLDSGPIGIFRELPDATRGVFKPFLFRVSASESKMLLLSRPVRGATQYELHSLQEHYDLTTGYWFVCDLDALERSVGPNGILTLVRHGHSKIFDCEIRLALRTVGLDVYRDDNHARRIYIPIQEFTNLDQRLLRGGDVGNKLKQYLDSAVGDRLDRLADELLSHADDQILGFDANRRPTLRGLQAQMQVEVSQLKFAMQTNVSLFQTVLSTSLRIDREAEIQAHFVKYTRQIIKISETVDQKFNNIASLEQNVGSTAESIRRDVEDAVNLALQSITSPREIRKEAKGQDNPARTINRGASDRTIHLLDLINITIEDIRPELTKDAVAAQREISLLHKESQEHLIACLKEMATMAKDYGGKLADGVPNWGQLPPWIRGRLGDIIFASPRSAPEPEVFSQETEEKDTPRLIKKRPQSDQESPRDRASGVDPVPRTIKKRAQSGDAFSQDGSSSGVSPFPD